MNRKEANILILGFISREIESNSDLRFNQILSSIGITLESDAYFEKSLPTIECLDYYEESEITLKRILNDKE
jgi:hypothetical protein